MKNLAMGAVVTFVFMTIVVIVSALGLFAIISTWQEGVRLAVIAFILVSIADYLVDQWQGRDFPKKRK